MIYIQGVCASISFFCCTERCNQLPFSVQKHPTKKHILCGRAILRVMWPVWSHRTHYSHGQHATLLFGHYPAWCYELDIIWHSYFYTVWQHTTFCWVPTAGSAQGIIQYEAAMLCSAGFFFYYLEDYQWHFQLYGIQLPTTGVYVWCIRWQISLMYMLNIRQ